MKQEETYVGIDVAKDRVDVSIRPGGDTWSANYDERGMSELVSCLRTAEPTAVLLEATGASKCRWCRLWQRRHCRW